VDQKPDYYGLLGLDRKATQDQIRAAFRNLALKFHPDRTPDEAAQQKFRRISEAYDALSDPESRKIYDQIGSDGLRGRTARDYRGADYGGIYRWMFGDGSLNGVFGRESPFGDGSAAGTGGCGANLRMEIEIAAGDATFGTHRSVEIAREEICGTCRGSRAMPGSWPAWCPRCDGKGEIVIEEGVFRNRKQTCPDCAGVGRRIVVACDGCRGAGTVPGEGDQSYWNGPPGDLNLDIRVRKGGRA
jgi:molecular chaperone DnaJ